MGALPVVHAALLGQVCAASGQNPCFLVQPGFLVVMLGACEMHLSMSDSLLLAAAITLACHAPAPSRWPCNLSIAPEQPGSAA